MILKQEKFKMKSLIKTLFERSGIDITEKQTDLFRKYYNLVVENNSDNDLTRIKGEENFIVRHFIDSVYYTKFIKLPGSLIDIGTGAGFPGIPLKIMFPELKIILAEQRSRRVDFLRLAVETLGLDEVEFYPHKVTDKSFFHVDGVITRALEDAPETLSRVHHFLPENGVIILLKGPDAEGDLAALSQENREYFELEVNREYILPGTSLRRKLLMFRKTGDRLKRVYKILKDEKETPGIAIVSAENKMFREMRRAADGDAPKKLGIITISGKKIITDYITGREQENCRLILPDGYTETDSGFMSVIDRFREANRLYIFGKSLFNELDTAAGKSPVLVADSPEIHEWDGSLSAGCNPVIPFQDPLNVGAAVRSCAAFGVTTIILTRDAANPFHPKSVRSSSGAVFNVRFYRGPSIYEMAELLSGKDVPLMTLDSEGRDLSVVEFPGTFIIVPGLEGPGLPPGLKVNTVSIPVSGLVESLNAPVALSIFLYAWREKMKK